MIGSVIISPPDPVDVPRSRREWISEFALWIPGTRELVAGGVAEPEG